jgi:hypothetical protein
LPSTGGGLRVDYALEEAHVNDRPCLALALASLALALALGAGGCKNDEIAKIAALETRVASLEKDNKELKRRLADLEQLLRGGRLATTRRPGAGGSLGGLQGLGQLLQGLTGALANASKSGGTFTVPSRRPRPRQMAPDLQRRIDKLIVDSLEKLAQNPDAKAFIKEMLRAMRRDLAGKTQRPQTPQTPRPQRP